MSMSSECTCDVKSILSMILNYINQTKIHTDDINFIKIC